MKPCKFDHNGECLICDCWPSDCQWNLLMSGKCKPEEVKPLVALFKDYLKVKITFSDGRRTYSETLGEQDFCDVAEHFAECQSNGANPDLEAMSLEDWTRSLPRFHYKDIGYYNGKHFIYGWVESFAQSDECPDWIRQAGDNLTVEVKDE